MDLERAIYELRAQKEKLERLIVSLEELAKEGEPATPKTPARRGRKSMGEAERRVVAERMRKYWASRKKTNAAAAANAGGSALSS